MHKVVLLGAAGQLAHDLLESLQTATFAFDEPHTVIPLTRQEVDITDREAVQTLLQTHQPRYLINTAAYNLVDQAESEPAAAYATNAFGPFYLAQACAAHGTTLMHFSTDYVFGEPPATPSPQPWRESDTPQPRCVYGASKLAGEQLLQAYCPDHYIIRTCGLYGIRGSRGKGGNFVETMLRLSQERSELRLVADQQCTPSFTADVAAAAVQLLTRQAPFGIYHLTNSGACTWKEFAATIFRLADRSTTCIPITAAEYGAAARRPPYSVLSLERWQNITSHTMPTWEDALQRYLNLRVQVGK